MPFILYIYNRGYSDQFTHTRLILRDPEVNDRVNPPMALRGLKLITIKEQTQGQKLHTPLV